MKTRGILPPPGGEGPLTLSEIELRPLPPNEMRVKVKAIGVNRADVSQAKGKYPPPPGASPVLGLELSGVVEEVGKAVTQFRIGDKVMSLVSGGAYAEYADAPEETSLALPSDYSFEEGAAIPEAYFTVWSNLFWKHFLYAGQTLLVHGGTSGVGSVAIQIAKFMGADVITTARTEEKCAACRKIGADLAICYTKEDFALKVKEFTDGKGVECVFDWIGAEYFERNLACLARRGTLVFINSQTGGRPTLPLSEVMGKELIITGSYLRPRSLFEKREIRDEIREKLWPHVSEPHLRPLLYKTFPLSEASKAHQVLLESSHIGKVVLMPSK
jgi:NADPH:quinone reductase